MDLQKVRQALIQNDFIIFASDYGKKAIAETWTKRLAKQVKEVGEFKDFQNYNIKTGSVARVVDVDLDCKEANLLADSFYQQQELSLEEALHLEPIDFLKS